MEYAIWEEIDHIHAYISTLFVNMACIISPRSSLQAKINGFRYFKGQIAWRFIMLLWDFLSLFIDSLFLFSLYFYEVSIDRR